MTKEELEGRILQLKQAIDQSIQNHNALCGRYAEAQDLLKMMFEKEVQEKEKLEKEVSDATS